MHPSEHVKGIVPFVFSVEAGSFTRAAERLNLSSSAVSKSIARLEARLGIALFERTTRTLSCTDAGRAYYETCKKILTDLKEAEAVLIAHDTGLEGRIRVDLPASFGRVRVMPLLMRLAARHPQLILHLSFTDRFVDLIEEGIDVAVRVGGPTESSSTLGHYSLGKERLVLCAAPAYLSTQAPPETIEALQQHQCIVYGRADGQVNAWSFTIDGVIQAPSIMPHRMIVGDGQAQLEAVRAGLGIAQLATWLAADDLASGKIVEIMPGHAIDGLPLHLIWRRNRQLTPKVDALLSALKNELTAR